MTYTIETSDTEEAALTAYVARENANAPSAGQAPWPDNQTYITVAAARMLLAPLVSMQLQTFVEGYETAAQQATLAQLQAAKAALP